MNWVARMFVTGALTITTVLYAAPSSDGGVMKSAAACERSGDILVGAEMDEHILLGFYLEELGLLDRAQSAAEERSLTEGRPVLFSELDLTQVTGAPVPSLVELRLNYKSRLLRELSLRGVDGRSSDPASAAPAACTNVCTKNCTKPSYANGQAAYQRASDSSPCKVYGTGYTLYYGIACTTQKYCK